MVFGMGWRKHVLAAGALIAAAAVPAVSTSVAASAQPAAAGMGAGHGGPSRAASARPAGAGRASHGRQTAASRAPALRRVNYRGYAFRIPRNWPVIDLAAHPATCVRFDRHVLYLGTPGASQSCPASLVGATEAVQVQPASSRQPAHALEDTPAHRVTVTAPRIAVTATYHDRRGQVLAVLASAGLPRPVRQNLAAMAAAHLRAGPAVPLSATDGSGLGFDACTAPSARVMQAWLAHSHYQAIGIYIGGSDRACAQPNLTAAWVSQQAAAGWHFFPLYVGPQAAFGEVTPGSAHRQAVSAADDAVVQAKQLGFGPGTPIYYDMEGYSPGSTRAALKFFSAWTTELHALGYRSAIYSSSSSGISDLANNYNSGAYAMPDVIDDAWWNGAANTSDPHVPPGEWGNHQRIHQFSGNVTQTHGGFTLNLDQDYLDVQVSGSGGGGGGGGSGASAAPSRQSSQAIALRRGGIDAFFAGTDHALWLAAYRPGSGWHHPASLGGTLASQPAAVAGAGGAIDVFYRGSDGRLWLVSHAGGGWSQPKSLGMGTLASPPVAVSDAYGDIEVFWRGADPAQLWCARYVPGSGWHGPRHLAKGVASLPSAAVSGVATVSVFWRGTDGQLWYASRSARHAWQRAAILSMGSGATGPHATGERSGEVDVLWGGTARGSVWHAAYLPGSGWAGQSLVARGRAGDPFVVASSAHTAGAFWQGADGGLWYALNAGGAAWSQAGPLGMGKIGGGVFAASRGRGKGTVDVFWTGSSAPALWHARYHPGSRSWTGPDNLGGSVG